LDGLAPANTSAIRVDAVPGSTQRYSGGGYTVMQQMMIDATGKTFPALMRENVLKPLQMNASTYEQPAAGAATGYYSNGEELEQRWRIYPELAAAGLWTTPADLARLAISIQEGFAGRSNPVISQAMTRQMLTVQQGKNGLANLGGLGVGLEGNGKTLRFFQGGRNAGFDSLLLAYAELGSGVVIMFNANDNSGVVKRIVNAVSKEYHWPGADQAKQ
jgi:CubicO group peptidase (beta-lactamase class C family)